MLHRECGKYYYIHAARNLLSLATTIHSHATVEKKEDCPFEEKCRTENIIYKCIVSTSGHLGTAERDFSKRYYNRISSFKNKTQMNKTTLAKYLSELKQKHNITPILRWYIVKSVVSCSNIF